MYQLHVLGTPQLTRIESGEAVSVGRQGMALLAALAVAGPRGLTRERIAALFWGESDDRQASQSLRQLLYRLRQLLGQDIVRGDHALSLNDSLIDIDLWQFRAAVRASDPQGAVAANGGTLLDGFHLPGEAGFGEWVEEERSRITRDMRGLLESARAACLVRRDYGNALVWSTRLVADDPLDADTAVAHAQLLRDAGCHDRAFRFLREYRAHAERELGGVPNRVDRVLDALQRSAPPPETAHMLEPSSGEPGHSEAPIPPVPATLPLRQGRARVSVTRLWFAASVALLIGTAHGPRTSSAAATGAAMMDAAPLDLSRKPPMPVIVFGRTGSRDTTASRIAERAVERALWSFRQQEAWATAREEKAGDPDEFDAIVRFEAGTFGDSVRLSVWYTDRDGTRSLLEEARFSSSEVDSAVGRVRDRLFGALALRLYPRFRDWPASAITRDLDAARAFAHALRMRTWQPDPLAGNVGFAEAVRHEPEFDLAKMLMVQEYLAAAAEVRPAEYFNGRSDVRADSLLPHLRSRASRMDAFELRFLEMLELFARPSPWADRIESIEAVRAHSPTSPVLRLQHAQALFASRRVTESLWLLDSIDLDPLGEEERRAILVLRADNLHALGRFDEERDLARRLLEVRSNDAPARWHFNLIHLRARAGLQETGLERDLDSLLREPLELGPRAVTRVADEMIAHRMTFVGAMVKNAVATPQNARFLRTRRNGAEHDAAIYWRAMSLAGGEQYGAADSLLNDPAFHAPVSMRTAWVGLAGTIAAHLGDSVRAYRIDRELAGCVGLECAQALAWRSRMAAALFDLRRAERLLDSAYAMGYPFSIDLHADAEFRVRHRMRQVRGVAEIR